MTEKKLYAKVNSARIYTSVGTSVISVVMDCIFND